jgi:hypothetical protein
MMSIRTLPAHFDGESIRLDEPYPLEPDAKLLVIVLPKQLHEDEQEDWMHLSQQALENAYGDQEPEYSVEAIIEPNPDYERR